MSKRKESPQERIGRMREAFSQLVTYSDRSRSKRPRRKHYGHLKKLKK